MQQPRPLRRRFERALSRFWIAEMLWWLVSGMLVCAIIGILAIFDGRHVPRWEYGITIGALVSVFATLASFTLSIPIGSAMGQLKWMWFQRRRPLLDFMIIERASLGPLGSLVLIAKRKGGVFGTAGAFLTITTLAINPFVQQVIQYNTMPIMKSDAAIPVIHKFDTVDRPRGIETPTRPEGLDMVLRAAINNAVLNLDGPYEVFDTPRSCSTGNCTWPIYKSVGICGNCVDLRDSIETSELPNKTIFSLANGVSVSSFHDGRPQGFPPTTVLSFMSNSHMRSVLLETFILVGSSSSSSYGNMLRQPLAAKCILSACQQTFQATEINGAFNDTTIELTISDSLWNSSDYLHVLRDHLIAQFRGEVLSDTVQISSNSIVEGLAIAVILGEQDIMIRHLAKGITNILRARSSSIVHGAATVSESFVKVEWVWMAMIIAHLFFVLAFWVAVSEMAESRRVHPWKDSSLASLFHGLNSHAMTMVKELKWEDDMEEAAKGIIVKMTLDAEGQKLSLLSSEALTAEKDENLDSK